MAKIIETLKLRTKFEIVKVEMDTPDLFSDEDYQLVENNPRYTHFRYLAGFLRPSDRHYFTFYLCSVEPRKCVSEKDLEMIKDIIVFSQL